MKEPRLRRSSSDKAGEAEVEEGGEGSDYELCDRTTAPVLKWEVLVGSRAVRVQLSLPATAAGWGRGVWARGSGC
jgi:hypothetical protein